MTTIPGFPKPSDPVRRRPDARFALRWVRFTGLRPTTVRAKFVSLAVAGDACKVSRDGGQADHRTCANKTGLIAFNEGCMVVIYSVYCPIFSRLDISYFIDSAYIYEKICRWETDRAKTQITGADTHDGYVIEP